MLVFRKLKIYSFSLKCFLKLRLEVMLLFMVVGFFCCFLFGFFAVLLSKNLSLSCFRSCLLKKTSSFFTCDEAADLHSKIFVMVLG